MTRWQTDDHEPARQSVEGLPLFGPGAATGHSQELARQGLSLAESAHGALLEQLVPIAQALAVEAGERGITVTDVRKEAYRRGILSGHEKRGTMSALGALMKRANLKPTGQYRVSDLDSTHARPQRVWRATAQEERRSA